MMTSLQRFLQELRLTDAEMTGAQPPPETLQRVVGLFAESHLHSHFTVVNGDFHILADSRPERVGRVLQDEELEKALTGDKIMAHGVGEGDILSLWKKGPLVFSAPFTVQGKNLGAIRAELALDDLREIHSRSQNMIFLYILFDAVVLVAFGFFLLSRIIVNPLKKLVQMSEKIGSGHWDALSGPVGGDEMGKVFSSFNRMSSRLREDRSKMKEYIRSLERVNRELRQAQSEVIRSEKLASIGRLAAGVAHEVGNPTGAILGYLDLLSKGGLAEEDEKEILKRAGTEAERIRRLIRELLDFARPSPEKEEEVNVNQVIENTLSLLSHQKGVWEKIQMIKEFQSDLPKWKGDPHQLQQVIVNLCLNAADALLALDSETGPDKRLKISTNQLTPQEVEEYLQSGSLRRKEDQPGADYSFLRTREPAEVILPTEIESGLRITVEDTGPGIPQEALGKIFDPFYSTKKPGEGTGLGLAICLRIVESYGGRLLVKSEAGKGTAFTILLPIFDFFHRGERREYEEGNP